MLNLFGIGKDKLVMCRDALKIAKKHLSVKRARAIVSNVVTLKKPFVYRKDDGVYYDPVAFEEYVIERKNAYLKREEEQKQEEDKTPTKANLERSESMKRYWAEKKANIDGTRIQKTVKEKIEEEPVATRSNSEDRIIRKIDPAVLTILAKIARNKNVTIYDIIAQHVNTWYLSKIEDMSDDLT